MAAVFVSYSRVNLPGIEHLVSGLERLQHRPWFDRRLTGGQAWWDEILRNIRECEVLIVAVSAESIDSAACKAEWRYAAALNKPIIPVMVARVSQSLLPEELGKLHVVDFREPNEESAFALAAAFGRLAEAPEPPNPLPEPPAMPRPPLSVLRERIDSEQHLELAEQRDILFELKAHLRNPKTVDDARLLLERLGRRPDVLRTIHDEISDSLAPPPPTPATQSQGLRAWLADRSPAQWVVAVLATRSLTPSGIVVDLAVAVEGAARLRPAMGRPSVAGGR